MRLIFCFVIILICLLIWSVFIEPNILTVNYLAIQDEQLKGLKLVFASDFHIKPYEIKRLNKIIKAINNENTDIVLLGGDYVNGHKKGNSLPIQDIAKSFSKIKSKYGTYAVVGNHDGWQGKEEVISALENNNIKFINRNA